MLIAHGHGKNFPSTFLPDSVNAIESNKFSGIFKSTSVLLIILLQISFSSAKDLSEKNQKCKY